MKAAEKLTPEQRTNLLEPLLAKNWTLVAGRDAIYKEFIFKDFNQVRTTIIIAYSYLSLINEHL